MVIDNGSEDETLEVAKKHTSQVYIAPDATVAELRNLGVQKSTGDILAFMDSDCTVGLDWFVNAGIHFSDNATVCFGSPPGFPDRSTWVQRCWFQIRRKGSANGEPLSVEWLESMNMFVRRDAFERVGGFDESMTTCEDYDLCTRLQDQGSILCDNRIVATHHGEAATVQRFFCKERWRGVSNVHSLRKHRFPLSELPSVVLPLVQVGLTLSLSAALLVNLLGAIEIPLLWFLAVVLVWQTPLALLASRKSGASHYLAQASGIYVLLNVYFLARGLSLFTGAAWGDYAQVQIARE